MAHEFKVKNGLIVDGKFYVKSGFTYNDLPQILVYNSGTTEVGFRDVDTIEGVTITGGTYSPFGAITMLNEYVDSMLMASVRVAVAATLNSDSASCISVA